MMAGYLLSSVVFQLPILALLITGLVLVGRRSAQIGPRSTLFARLGLGLLLLETVLGFGWSVLLPGVVRSSRGVGGFQQIAWLYGLASGAVFLAGVGLLVAAIVARPAAAPVTGPPGFAGPAFAGAPYSPPESSYAPPAQPGASFAQPGGSSGAPESPYAPPEPPSGPTGTP